MPAAFAIGAAEDAASHSWDYSVSIVRFLTPRRGRLDPPDCCGKLESMRSPLLTTAFRLEHAPVSMESVIGERPQQIVGVPQPTAEEHGPAEPADGAPQEDDARQSNDRARLSRSALRAVQFRGVMFRSHRGFLDSSATSMPAQVASGAGVSKQPTTDVMCGRDFRPLLHTYQGFSPALGRWLRCRGLGRDDLLERSKPGISRRAVSAEKPPQDFSPVIGHGSDPGRLDDL